MKSKFQNNINELLQEQIISKEVAQNIENYYNNKPNTSTSKLFTVFSVLGSTLIGLGIILILAHNWDHFVKGIKTTLAFLPLVIAQFFVGFSILKKKSKTWKEASGVFLFFTVGSSMALVAQIYNIPGDLSSYLLTWIALCLPLIYLLNSHVLAIVSLVFTTYYACAYGYFYNTSHGTPWLYIVLLAVIIPYYIMLIKQKTSANIVSVLNWFFPLSLTIVLASFVQSNESLGYVMYVCLFGCFYNLGKLPHFNNIQLRRNGYLVLGSLGTVFMLLLSSFEWIWKDVLKDNILVNGQETYVLLVLFITSFGLLFFNYLKKGVRSLNLYQFIFIIFSGIFFTGFYGLNFPVVFINVLILLLGIMAVKIGADKYHFGVLNYGLFIIVILIVCRFFDTNMSFVIRGLLFVSVGVGFFLTNYIMLNKKKLKEVKR
ncbi:DUF2157 domain-containing protein [Postechiella marina]|uniref:DUF2157 domain-containing protein n=1 Tax=Postechiella marina TaxID=943941 RepID=A0ABP8C9V1_9FLAO